VVILDDESFARAFEMEILELTSIEPCLQGLLTLQLLCGRPLSFIIPSFQLDLHLRYVLGQSAESLEVRTLSSLHRFRIAIWQLPLSQIPRLMPDLGLFPLPSLIDNQQASGRSIGRMATDDVLAQRNETDDMFHGLAPGRDVYAGWNQSTRAAIDSRGREHFNREDGSKKDSFLRTKDSSH
jgi:hypothetical protein